MKTYMQLKRMESTRRHRLALKLLAVLAVGLVLFKTMLPASAVRRGASRPPMTEATWADGVASMEKLAAECEAEGDAEGAIVYGVSAHLAREGYRLGLVEGITNAMADYADEYAGPKP